MYVTGFNFATTASQSGNNSNGNNAGLNMNKALTSPISRSAIAVGKMSAISLIAALQASLIIGIALAIGVTFPNPLMIIPIMGIVILFSLGFSGISVTLAATAKSQETFWGMINLLGMPLFMLSPALFPLELLPDWLAVVAKLKSRHIHNFTGQRIDDRCF